MDNQEYWKNRSVWRMYEDMQKAEETADDIAKVYLKSSRWLQLVMEGIFERYMTKHKLSETEARKLLDSMNGTTVQEMLQKLKNGEADQSKKELLAELEAPAYQFRLSRLAELQRQIDAVMQSIYQQEQQISTAFYESLAEDTYYRSIFEIQKRSGLAFNFSHIDNKQIDRVLSMNWSGKHYSDRIWKNTGDLAQTLKEEMLVSLLTGRPERETAELISNKFASGAMQARRLVRTESAFVSGELTAKSYEECGIEKYRFLATLDLRTSEICRSLDGKEFLVSDRKTGKNYPPMHPWCRSTTLSVISDESLKKMERAAYNPKTGRTEKVPASMTYREWYKKYVEGNPEALAEEKAIKNHASDKKQYENYKKVLGNDLPDSFVKFQKMKYNEPDRWKFMKLDYQRRNELLQHPDKKLPNAENVTAAEAKFTKYLFGGNHSEGLAKGRAFTSRLGYDYNNWEELRKEVLSSANKYPARFLDNNGYGDRYEQKIILYGKKGTPANVLAGWMQKPDGSVTLSSVYIKEIK